MFAFDEVERFPGPIEPESIPGSLLANPKEMEELQANGRVMLASRGSMPPQVGGYVDVEASQIYTKEDEKKLIQCRVLEITPKADGKYDAVLEFNAYKERREK